MDRERAYYFLGEALRRKNLPRESIERFNKDFLARIQKQDTDPMTKEEIATLKKDFKAFQDEEIAKFRTESRGYFQKLVESYPNSEWSARAKDRLLEMGQANVREELDS